MILDEVQQICIVGNSGNMIGSNLGSKIDKQRYVARFGAGLPEHRPELKKDIGIKTDIYIKRQIPWKYKDLNIRYVFTKLSQENTTSLKEKGAIAYPLYVNPEETRSHKNKWELQRNKIYKNMLQDFINKTNYDAQKLTSGLAFIFLCLTHKVPKINICGFTTNENYNPDERYDFSTADSVGYELAALAGRLQHDLKKEKDYISQLIKEKKIQYLTK